MRLSSERGAVLIHALMALMVFAMFSAAVIDYGALLVSRNQAQNAADAAALAGATSLGFDHPPGDRWDRARNVAWETGYAQKVWGERPAIVPTSPYDGAPCQDYPQRCVRADVYRNGANGSTAIPTMLAGLFGFNNQGVRAMAVAESAPATGSDCLKPVLVADRYVELTGDPNFFDVGDYYERPSINGDGSMNYGTGWTPYDIGATLTLKEGDPSMTIAAGNYYAIDDPAAGITGAAEYEAGWAGCRIRRNIGEMVSVKDGRMIGPTRSGFEQLMDATNGDATVIIGMFDPSEYEGRRRRTGNQPIMIVNLLAFKLDRSSYDTSTKSITGTIVGAPSELLTPCNTPPCSTSSGLVSVIRLIR